MEHITPKAIQARTEWSCQQGSNLVVVVVTSMLVHVVAGTHTHGSGDLFSYCDHILNPKNLMDDLTSGKIPGAVVRNTGGWGWRRGYGHRRCHACGCGLSGCALCLSRRPGSLEEVAAGAGAGTALAGTGFGVPAGEAAGFAYAGPEAIATFPGKEPMGLSTFSETREAGSVMLQLP
jgi:hypothetical protein